MKIKINRNILWAETFVNTLANLGIKYVCLSPGSRNTPLTIAFARHKSIKSYILVDERSNGFFALGLAKASSQAVVLVCTSGTAVAEFYPAIIEAYQQRVPLIVCTADRPAGLIGKGANQTINQHNIYANHIFLYEDAGMPDTNKESLDKIQSLAEKLFTFSTLKCRGPVHINFPFDKPFEPGAFTDEIDVISGENYSTPVQSEVLQEYHLKDMDKLIDRLKSTRRGLIIAGPGEFNEKFVRLITLLAHKLHFPIVADAASQLRFGSHDKNNVLSYFEGYIRTDLFKKEYLPEIIIHFGRFPTSKGMEEYLANVNCQYYLISEFGDIFDPCGKVNHIEQINPIVFLEQVLNRLESEKIIATESEWYRKFKSVEKQTVDIKREIIDNSPFPFEGRIINEVINLMPDGSHLMISNSMPVRDLDYFSEPVDRKITVYNNRGASGIDGIISTALGIAAAKKKPVVLVTGDLAFYYDLNGLLASKKYKIPLVVVLINNNGGGIFEMLPISTYEDVFEEYFVTPLDLDFAGIVNAYSGKFCTMKNWINFRENFASALNMLELNVLEIKTNAGQSVELRRRFWAQVGKSV